MTVRLTWTTMVTYWSVKLLIIWLRNISMQVGRVTWCMFCARNVWSFRVKIVFDYSQS